MNAGELTQKIIIRAFATTVDHGVPKQTWFDFATVWAKIEPISGREYLGMDKKSADVTTRIRIRYLACVRPSFRVFHGPRKFVIEHAIDIDERHEEIELMCREIVE